MKKVIWLTGIGISCFLISCTSSTSKTGSDATVQTEGEKNVAKNRLVYQAIESGNTAALDSIIAPDAVDHSVGADMMSDMKGGDSIKAMLGHVKNNFTDLKMEIIATAADGDYVFTLSRMIGTASANPGMGMKPNQKVDGKTVDVVKFSNGKMTEHWSYMDPKDMMAMMPPGGGKMDDKMGGKMMDNKMKDTTKKK